MAKGKNNKEINTKKNKKGTTYIDELKKLGIISGIIVLIIGILYLIVGIFITKDIKWFDKDDGITETIQYKEILAGETFNKNNEEYYVIFADSTGNYYTLYETIIDNNSDKKIYIVDTANPLNTLYISDETNSNVQQISDLKVKSDTLIKIQNKQNVLYIEGKNEIINHFK